MNRADFEKMKWEEEVALREKELAACLAISKEEMSARLAESAATKKPDRFFWTLFGTLAATLLTVAGTLYVASGAAESARTSSEKSAESARLSAESSASSARYSAEQAANAMRESAERSASSARESADRNARSALESADRNARNAQLNQQRNWEVQLRDEQRRALHVAVAEFVAALSKAVIHAQKVTSEAGLRGREPTDQEYIDYDVEQRQNILAVNVAGAKLFMESPEVAEAFSPLHVTFVIADERVSQLLRRKDLDRRRERWLELNRMLTDDMQFKKTLEKVRPLLVRPGVEPRR